MTVYESSPNRQHVAAAIVYANLPRFYHTPSDLLCDLCASALSFLFFALDSATKVCLAICRLRPCGAANTMSRLRALFQIATLLFGVATALAQNHFLCDVVEEFALRVKQGARVGEQVSVPDSIYRELSARADKSAATCNETLRRALSMDRILPAPKGEQAFAVFGRGFCYCTLEGNCRFWIVIYREQKFEKILELKKAETFGFVSSKSALPLLIVWTRLAPTEFGARVFHFYGGKIRRSGRVGRAL
jgi:hypothetical protein